MVSYEQVIDEYFRTLEVSTIVGCPVKCTFCPQDLYVSAYQASISKSNKVISFENFCISLDNLVGSNVSKILFSGYTENFVNKAFPRMVIEAHTRGYAIEVITTGYALNQHIVDELASIPFRRFCFSIQPPGLNNRPGIKDEDALWQIIRYATEHLKNVRVDVVLPPATQTEGLDMVKRFAAEHDLKFGAGWHDRAGNLSAAKPQITHQSRDSAFFCNLPLANVLQPSGDLSLCCMDWSLDHVIGNLYTDKYINIINNVVVRQFLDDLRAGNLDALRCKHCHYLHPIEEWTPFKERKSRFHFLTLNE